MVANSEISFTPLSAVSLTTFTVQVFLSFLVTWMLCPLVNWFSKPVCVDTKNTEQCVGFRSQKICQTCLTSDFTKNRFSKTKTLRHWNFQEFCSHLQFHRGWNMFTEESKWNYLFCRWLFIFERITSATSLSISLKSIMNELQIIERRISANVCPSWCVEKWKKSIHSKKFDLHLLVIWHLSWKHEHFASIDVTSHPPCLMDGSWFQKMYTTWRSLPKYDECVYGTFTIVVSWKCCSIFVCK